MQIYHQKSDTNRSFSKHTTNKRLYHLKGGIIVYHVTCNVKTQPDLFCLCRASYAVQADHFLIFDTVSLSVSERFLHRQISMFFAIRYDTAKIAIIHKPAKILRSFNVLNQRFTI